MLQFSNNVNVFVIFLSKNLVYSYIFCIFAQNFVRLGGFIEIHAIFALFVLQRTLPLVALIGFRYIHIPKSSAKITQIYQIIKYAYKKYHYLLIILKVLIYLYCILTLFAY